MPARVRSNPIRNEARILAILPGDRNFDSSLPFGVRERFLARRGACNESPSHPFALRVSEPSGGERGRADISPLFGFRRELGRPPHASKGHPEIGHGEDHGPLRATGRSGRRAAQGDAPLHVHSAGPLASLPSKNAPTESCERRVMLFSNAPSRCNPPVFPPPTRDQFVSRWRGGYNGLLEMGFPKPCPFSLALHLLLPRG